MKIEGTYTIHVPRTTLWPMLIDPAVLQRCVPGCEALETNEDGTYKMLLKAGVGSIKGVFNGQITLAELRAPEHYRMIVEGTGKVGFVKGAGTLDLVEEGEATVINYAGDVSVGGTLAGVGQRMIVASAKMMAGQFFKAVEAEAKPPNPAEDETKPGLMKRLLKRVAGSAEETETQPEQP